MGRIPNTLADLFVHHLVRIIIKAVCVVWERGKPKARLQSFQIFSQHLRFPFISGKAVAALSSLLIHRLCRAWRRDHCQGELGSLAGVIWLGFLPQRELHNLLFPLSDSKRGLCEKHRNMGLFKEVDH